MKSINIICPVYNEENCIDLFFAEIKKLKSKLVDYNLQLIFTNNNSQDETYNLCKKICDEYKWVKLLTFTRNFGYQASILAGLKEFEADFYSIVDVDLQDPPEMIEDFLNKITKDNMQIVFGERSDRDENFVIKNLRKLYYKLLQKIADQDFQINMAEFLVMTNEVKKNIVNNNNSNIFIRNEIAYTGFKRSGIKFKRKKRVAGKGVGESIVYMIVYGFAGIIATSTLPLRICFYLFWPLAFMNFIFLISMEMISYKFLIISNLLFLSFAISFISIYLARIYKDVIARPLYIIDYTKSVT